MSGEVVVPEAVPLEVKVELLPDTELVDGNADVADPSRVVAVPISVPVNPVVPAHVSEAMLPTAANELKPATSHVRFFNLLPPQKRILSEQSC